MHLGCPKKLKNKENELFHRKKIKERKLICVVWYKRKKLKMSFKILKPTILFSL